MKKLILASSILFIMGTTGATAQEVAKINPTEMKEKIKAILTKELQLTSDQADVVAKIKMEYDEQIEFIIHLPEEEREPSIKSLQQKMYARLKAELKDDTLINKVVKWGSKPLEIKKEEIEIKKEDIEMKKD
jgi:hypothetical protein